MVFIFICVYDRCKIRFGFHINFREPTHNLNLCDLKCVLYLKPCIDFPSVRDIWNSSVSLFKNCAVAS